MTDFGKRTGDMFKSTYDPDKNGVIAAAQTEADMKKSVYDIDASNIVDDSESTAAHATKHQYAGTDQINATGLLGRKNLVNRGDPFLSDFTETNLTTNATWQDLDLSAIVPAGATAVELRCGINDGLVASVIIFRKKGHTHLYNAQALYIQVANIPYDCTFTLFCDANRLIEYYATNTTWTNINIIVLGWWI